MKVHPGDLARLNRTLPSGGPDTQKAGWAMAFLRVCEALEDQLVLSDDDRAQWLEGIGALKFHIPKTAMNPETTARHIGVKATTFKALQEIAERSWRGPSSGIRELPFIRDPRLRRLAERDLASMEAALRSEETKCATILAGCVVEAILLDLAEQDPATSTAKAATIKAARKASDPNRWGRFDPNSIDTWSLYHLVVVSGPNGLGALTARTEKIADTVRDFRNFVHPRMERDELGSATLSPSDAIVASSLTQIVIQDVRAWRATQTSPPAVP